MLLTLMLMGIAYWVPSTCPVSSAPGMILSRSPESTTSERSASRPWSAKSFMMPGCGNIATSGASLPCTRVLISELKSLLWVNLTVMSFCLAQAFTSSLKPVSWSVVNAYMTSMVLLVLLLPPPPPPELRQPVVSRPTAPRTAPVARVDLLGMCTPSDTLLGRKIPAGGEPPAGLGSWDRLVREAIDRWTDGQEPGSGAGHAGDVAGDAEAGVGVEDVGLLGGDLDVHDLAL